MGNGVIVKKMEEGNCSLFTINLTSPITTIFYNLSGFAGFFLVF